MLGCAFAIIFSGYILDIGYYAGWLTEAHWCSLFLHARDIQTIGFALLAFLVCPYNRTELKASTFFLVLWRVLVFGINCFDIGQGHTLLSLLLLSAVYLTWFLKAWLMGEYKHSNKQPGAYYIFFPVHSVWGLLQSVFLPWHPARYESRMVSDGKSTWLVNKKKFVKYENEMLNIDKLDHVKVYLGRTLTTNEIMRLDIFDGSKAMPGWKDCREFLIK